MDVGDKKGGETERMWMCSCERARERDREKEDASVLPCAALLGSLDDVRRLKGGEGESAAQKM